MASIPGAFVISHDGTKIWTEAIGDQTKPAVVFLHAVAFEKQFADTALRDNLYLVGDAQLHFTYACPSRRLT